MDVFGIFPDNGGIVLPRQLSYSPKKARKLRKLQQKNVTIHVYHSCRGNNRLEGERWFPTTLAGTPLRVPIPGTLEALMIKHQAFLNRLGPDGFRPVPPLTAFGVTH